MTVFETQFNKASLLDRISGAEMTNTDTTFVRSDKGLVAKYIQNMIIIYKNVTESRFISTNNGIYIPKGSQLLNGNNRKT